MHNTRCIWASLMYKACVPLSPQYNACVPQCAAMYIACESDALIPQPVLYIDCGSDAQIPRSTSRPYESLRSTSQQIVKISEYYVDFYAISW